MLDFITSAVRFKEYTPHDSLINLDDIVKLYRAQRGRCALSGRMMEVGRGGGSTGRVHPWGLSIDRLDCSKGYTHDNIRLLCTVVNLGRGNKDDEVYLQYVRDVAAYWEGKELPALPEGFGLGAYIGYGQHKLRAPVTMSLLGRFVNVYPCGFDAAEDLGRPTCHIARYCDNGTSLNGFYFNWGKDGETYVVPTVRQILLSTNEVTDHDCLLRAAEHLAALHREADRPWSEGDISRDPIVQTHVLEIMQRCDSPDGNSEYLGCTWEWRPGEAVPPRDESLPIPRTRNLNHGDVDPEARMRYKHYPVAQILLGRVVAIHDTGKAARKAWGVGARNGNIQGVCEGAMFSHTHDCKWQYATEEHVKHNHSIQRLEVMADGGLRLCGRYPSLVEAASACIDVRSSPDYTVALLSALVDIMNCCEGERSNAFGYRWRYASPLTYGGSLDACAAHIQYPGGDCCTRVGEVMADEETRLHNKIRRVAMKYRKRLVAVFPNVRAAEQALGVRNSKIPMICKGERDYYENFRWAWATEADESQPLGVNKLREDGSVAHTYVSLFEAAFSHLPPEQRVPSLKTKFLVPIIRDIVDCCKGKRKKALESKWAFATAAEGQRGSTTWAETSSTNTAAGKGKGATSSTPATVVTPGPASAVEDHDSRAADGPGARTSLGTASVGMMLQHHLLAVFASVDEAECVLGIADSDIAKACKDERMHSNHFYWTLGADARDIPTVQKVCVHTGRVLATYASLFDAALGHTPPQQLGQPLDTTALKLAVRAFIDCCQGKRTSAFGYSWQLSTSEVQRVAGNSNAVTATAANKATSSRKAHKAKQTRSPRSAVFASGTAKSAGMDSSDDEAHVRNLVQRVAMKEGKRLVAVFPNVFEAQKVLRVPRSKITLVCQGSRKFSNDFRWAWAMERDENNVPKVHELASDNITVAHTYPSLFHAGLAHIGAQTEGQPLNTKALAAAVRDIILCCKGKCPTAFQRTWRFDSPVHDNATATASHAPAASASSTVEAPSVSTAADDEEDDDVRVRNTTTRVAMSLSGCLLAVFTNIPTAREEVGIVGKSKIALVCNKKRPSTFNFNWAWATEEDEANVPKIQQLGRDGEVLHTHKSLFHAAAACVSERQTLNPSRYSLALQGAVLDLIRCCREGNGALAFGYQWHSLSPLPPTESSMLEPGAQQPPAKPKLSSRPVWRRPLDDPHAEWVAFKSVTEAAENTEGVTRKMLRKPLQERDGGECGAYLWRGTYPRVIVSDRE